MLSFKPFCSTGAVYQFSHLRCRGDKELAGKFTFASGYTVVLSLYQPEMKLDSRKRGTRKGVRSKSLLGEAVGPDQIPTPLF